jgi:hypothetical protein
MHLPFSLVEVLSGYLDSMAMIKYDFIAYLYTS